MLPALRGEQCAFVLGAPGSHLTGRIHITRLSTCPDRGIEPETSVSPPLSIYSGELHAGSVLSFYSTNLLQHWWTNIKHSFKRKFSIKRRKFILCLILFLLRKSAYLNVFIVLFIVRNCFFVRLILRVEVRGVPQGSNLCPANLWLLQLKFIGLQLFMRRFLHLIKLCVH